MVREQHWRDEWVGLGRVKGSQEAFTFLGRHFVFGRKSG